jgi:mono/diheme cytochrome c family protein
MGHATAAGAASSSRIDRGRYLANGVARCFWCHTALNDADPATPRPERFGSGDILDPKVPIVAGNLTPDATTGLGRWTDAEIVRAIRDGRGRDGHALRGEHPSTYYSVMTDEDAASIVAYLRSLAPVRRSLPRSAAAKRSSDTVQPPTPPATEAALRTPLDRGRYLVQLGECMGCHTTTTASGQPFRGMEFGGGRRFYVDKGIGNEVAHDRAFTDAARRSDPAGARYFASANITSDPSGIAFYTADIFRQAIRTGRVGGVRPLSAAMPWVFFRTMSDEDLDAVFAFLASVPPVRHRISNVDPPAFCAVCGRRHGLGELN